MFNCIWDTFLSFFSNTGSFLTETRPRVQLCQAPRLDKGKEWTSFKIGFRFVEFKF